MIFYFTGTGNSLDISNRLAERLDDRAVSIADEIGGPCSYRLEEGETVGIVSPIYFYGLPTIVEDFIGRMSFDREPSMYLVLSFGTYPAQALARAERLLSSKGFRLSARLCVRMPENYVMLFDPPDEREAGRILSSAYAEIEEFASAMASGRPVDMVTDENIWHRTVGALARPIYVHGRRTGRFYADTRCTGCGTCARICPSRAIEMVDRIPTWTKDRCIRCNACLNRCPMGALQFGRGTKGRGRYVNPNVRL